MERFGFCQTPVGTLKIVQQGEAIVQISLYTSTLSNIYGVQTTPLIQQAIGQLEEYFTTPHTTFQLPLAPEGTDFQKKVWRALCEIPYGETRTYGQIARQIGHPKAFRAVGLANHNNPIPIVIPCHRVIGANNMLTGYAYGLSIKQQLLDWEIKHKPIVSSEIIL